MTRKNTCYDDDDCEMVHLPALHQNMTKALMYEKLKNQYPNKQDRMGKTLFYEVANRITHTEEKSLRALDYNITDLLQESHQRLKCIILDLYEKSHPLQCQKLLEDLAEIYSVVQH